MKKNPFGDIFILGFKIFAVIVVVITLSIFSYYIRKQTPLDIKDLEILVEEEMVQFHKDL